MLNKITLQGRLTRDPEPRNTQSQIAFCNFCVASERNFSGQDGQKQTDFINCVAWRKTAEFLGRYFHKGDMILLSGTLQSRKYDDNGQQRTMYEVLVEEINFCGGQAQNQTQNPYPAQSVPLPDDGALPFDV